LKNPTQIAFSSQFLARHAEPCLSAMQPIGGI
jgi:hypothetical protein